MTADRWRQIESTFAQVCECAPSEQEALLSRLCRGDEELRREVESLLANDTPGEELVHIPASLQPRKGDETEFAFTGRRAGPYRLIRRIGHGGMGAVYLGVRDDDQFQKQVAIKLLKRGMDTKHMLSRFRQERQILANLEHPFIGRLMDGGATDDGLPYFVMEYVDGLPITSYCIAEKLSIPERLRLFRLVCEAVQYAHQNLVVHRDLKPSNILTTKEGVPKLLDFGIAKVLAQGAPPDATFTERGPRLLTPDYASPEQVKGLPISTSSDIYSLGAVLYELLTGVRAHRFPSESYADMEKTICETEPEKPSLAARRNERLPLAERKFLKKRISGDLDNIILTALRKEPQRRYSSAAEFSEDLRRHLEARPVLAREDRWTYRADKFIRRNRVGVAAAALLVASLVGGIVATTVQARRAERRFQLVRGLANTMLFDMHDKLERLPGSTALRLDTIRTVVTYLDSLARDGPQDPELDLEIATAYVRAGHLEGNPFYSNLGHGATALANYRKAIAIYERLARHQAFQEQAISGLVDTYLTTSFLESMLGDPKASAVHEAKAKEVAAAAGNDSRLPFGTQSRLYHRLAEADYERGDATAELAFRRKGLAICQRWVQQERGPSSLECETKAYRHLGSAFARNGDLGSAIASFRKSLAVSEELRRHPAASQEQRYIVLDSQTVIGDILAAPDDPNFGDAKAAEGHYLTALALAEEYAAADPNNIGGRRYVAFTRQRLGMVNLAGHPEKAVEYYQRALRAAEDIRAVDPRNAEYLHHASRAYAGLGEALYNLDRADEALPYLNRAAELQRTLAANSPERIWNLRMMSHIQIVLGGVLLARGESDRALLSLREALTVAGRMLERAPSSLYHQLDRAEALEAMGKFYATLAQQQRLSYARRAECKREARSNLEQGLAIWTGWKTRKLSEPYASRREKAASALLASLGPPN